jgi:glycogen operon protein
MQTPRISRGAPRPYGASLFRGGVNFAIFSKHATHAWLVFFDSIDGSSTEIALDPDENRTGHVWHVLVRGVDPGIGYCWRFDRDPNENPAIHRFDPHIQLLDPYATAISGGEEWGPRHGLYRTRRCVVPSREFDWEHDKPLNVPLADSVIYEMHVRGFTRHDSSEVAHPGTFRGVIEKIPYLQALGITAVELLPVHEFEEGDTDPFNPLMGVSLVNLWGYQTLNFFSPNGSFAADPRRGGQVIEFKEMVKALHKAGIEVILDVVFNHTGEGNENGFTRSFRGIDNSVYYIIDPETGAYMNYSGCGNTMNCNHPVVRRMIVDCLHYWVTEMHVDGFRFDLASILGRGQDGTPLPNPPLLEELANDPILANAKLIAEAWDAAGLYQVGTFPSWGRWAEWNGRFRDDVRRFVRGDAGMVSALATRLTGSADLYGTSAREPYHSINFVTAHDGFTLRDLVSYNEKHNLANGEDNRDGSNNNNSWNHGVEGDTDDPAINALRLRQQKNFATILLLSHGVPMILSGDEMNRTQRGNNNAYCQDNEIGWINWKDAERNAGLVRFFRNLIRFRLGNPLLRRRTFLDHANGLIRWHGVKRDQPDWGFFSRTLGMQLSEDGAHMYVMFNAFWEDLPFELPHLGLAKWSRFLDTSLASPEDIAEPDGSFPIATQDCYVVRARSVVALVA